MAIKITQKNKNVYEVEVSEKNTTFHEVTLDEETFEKLARGKTREKFIRNCFEFLLKREPKENILSRFNVRVIREYFPEFEREIIE
ncbi:MAG: hypothetical protein V1644_03610 [Candidatus Micrarchaeota archaeon]